MLIIVWTILQAAVCPGTSIDLQLQLRKEQGIIRLEDPDTIVYENTIPIIYDIQLEKEEAKKSSPNPPTKWSNYYNDSIGLMKKLIGEYDQAVEDHLSKLKPQSTRSKNKRFSVIGWILGECCGVATTDQFNHLYQDSQNMLIHMEAMKQTVHSDHQALAQEITGTEELADEVSLVINKTKQVITDTLIQQVTLEGKEEILTTAVLSIYKKIDKMIQIERLNMASISCQNKKLPLTLVDPQLLSKDLIKIEKQIGNEYWELAISSNKIGKYYHLPITSCIIAEDRFVIRTKIPIVRKGQNWRMSHIVPVPIGDSESTCYTRVTNNKIVSSSKINKIIILEDKNCMADNRLCYIPRDAKYIDEDQLANEFSIECVNQTETLVTHITEEKYGITHPPKQIQVTCSKNTEEVTLPAAIHGYLELHVPCSCQIFFNNNFRILDQFPCDKDWPEKMGYYHIIPTNWTLLSHEEVDRIAKNESMIHQEKLNKIMQDGWEFKKKHIQLEPEVNASIFQQFFKQTKEQAQAIHLEWTTVLTILIILFLLRKPINLLLIKLIGSRPSPTQNFSRDQVVLDLEIRPSQNQ